MTNYGSMRMSPKQNNNQTYGSFMMNQIKRVIYSWRIGKIIITISNINIFLFIIKVEIQIAYLIPNTVLIKEKPKSFSIFKIHNIKKGKRSFYFPLDN